MDGHNVLPRLSDPLTRVLNGPGPVLALIIGAAVVGALHGGFTDLFVYQFGGRAVLHALPIYSLPDPVTGLYFSYPPFAAVIMAPLALLPTWLAAAVWTGSSVAATSAVIVLVRRTLEQPAPGWLVALVAIGALALEPVWQNLAFGQINVLLMLAVMVDLVRPERRWSGLLVGIAAGLKLTPLVFVVLLIMIGRRAAAGRAALALAGTVAIGFVMKPGSSLTYWDAGLLDVPRVGPAALAHNQSVNGALTRLFDGPPRLWLWLAIAGPLALAVLIVGAGWWRRGDRVLGTGLAALAMLLASPISWSHHWVWAVPIALALRNRSRFVCAAWTAVFVVRPIIWPPYGRGREYGWSPVEHLVGNAYVLAALTLSVWGAVALFHQVGSDRPHPGGNWRPWRKIDRTMALRTRLLTLLVTCAALLLPVVVDGSGLAVVSASASLLCAITFVTLAAPAMSTRPAVVTIPVNQRLHGRFLQQSRPGVPGRTRARAPGCGR